MTCIRCNQTQELLNDVSDHAGEMRSERDRYKWLCDDLLGALEELLCDPAAEMCNSLIRDKANCVIAKVKNEQS
jgi:hypothetical protein